MRKFARISLFLLLPSLAFAQSAGQGAGHTTTSSTSSSSSTPSADQSPSNADLQKIIQNLVTQLTALQQQVASLRGELGATAQATSTSEVQGEASEAVPPELTRTLSRGSSGDDVRKLQEFLAKERDIYPDGLITGYFGALTEAAVKRWQEKHDIESVGAIGPKTMAKFQELGHGRVQELIQEGAGQSGTVPQGLLTAPGIQKKLESATTTAGQATSTYGVATSTPFGASSTAQITTSSAPFPASTSTSYYNSGGPGNYGSPTPASQTSSPAASSTTVSSTTSSSTSTGTTSTAPTTTTTTTATSTADTTPPSVPHNLSASVVSTSQINLSWSASSDTSGIVGYKIYRGGTQIVVIAASMTANSPPTTYSDTGLQASTAYTYTIAAYDAAGNVSSQSTPASVATLSAGPPAPTNVQAVTSGSSMTQPPGLWYYVSFDYTLQPTTQSFNVYRKRPSDGSFVKYTYSAQTPVNPSILPLPGSDQSNLYHRNVNQWQWWTTLPYPAPTSAQGDYQFYVTAVDTSGIESAQSNTKSFKLYAAPTILSPADGSTVYASPSPTITISGDPNVAGQTYGMALYQSLTSNIWTAWPPPSMSFTYAGPTLDPANNPYRLVVWSSSGFNVSFYGVSIFTVASPQTTSTATSTSLDMNTKSDLASILLSLSEIVKELQKLLR